MTIKTALFKLEGKVLTALKIGLNEPADPPKSSMSDLCQRLIISGLRANFLVYIFFLIDYFKLLFKKV